MCDKRNWDDGDDPQKKYREYLRKQDEEMDKPRREYLKSFYGMTDKEIDDMDSVDEDDIDDESARKEKTDYYGTAAAVIDPSFLGVLDDD